MIRRAVSASSGEAGVTAEVTRQNPPPHQLRHHVQHDLVHQPRGQPFPGDADPAGQQDVPPFRDRPRLLHRAAIPLVTNV